TFTPQMFGAKAELPPGGIVTNFHDDWPALEKLVGMRMPGSNPPTYPKGPDIYFPPGRYNLRSCTNGIRVKALTHFVGCSSGLGGATQGSQLIFPRACPGFVIEWLDTLDDEYFPGTNTGTGYGSSIRYLHLEGGVGDNREA